jgi:uncharacterized membrane protein
MNFRESHWRTLLKTFSWRFLAMSGTFLLVYIMTGETVLAASISSLEFLFKLVAYYAHERLWDRVHVGKQPQDQLETEVQPQSLSQT